MSIKTITLSAICLIFGFHTCLAQEWTSENLTSFDKFDEIEHIFQYEGDTTYVINFWATWCGPCVKELPYFEDLPEVDPNGKPIKVILVSLDFINQLESRLIPFLNDNSIKSEVIFLKDSKYNDWIDRVDPEWSGAIPITVIYNKQGRIFLEREFHSVEEIVAQIPTS